MPPGGRSGNHFKACAELPRVSRRRELRLAWQARPAQLLGHTPASH